MRRIEAYRVIDAAVVRFGGRVFHKATLQDGIPVSDLSPGSSDSPFAGETDFVYTGHRSSLQGWGTPDGWSPSQLLSF